MSGKAPLLYATCAISHDLLRVRHVVQVRIGEAENAIAVAVEQPLRRGVHVRARRRVSIGVLREQGAGVLSQRGESILQLPTEI